MKKIMFNYDLEMEGLYSVGDVIGKFPDYFGMSLEELSDSFSGFPTISEKELESYVRSHISLMEESKSGQGVPLEKILSRVRQDYVFYMTKASLLASKGLDFLNLFCYLYDLPKHFIQNEEYEKLLQRMGIFHYSSVMIGRDIQVILIAFSHLVKQFFETCTLMNCLDTYQMRSVDSFALCYKEKIYPCPSLVLEDGYSLDKTSVFPKHSVLCRGKNWY